MSEEQLSIDFSATQVPPVDDSELTSYEALDYQLADLMLELNGEENQILKECTRNISKHTREGQIAIACSQEQKIALLKTKVVGKADDYKPLILDNGYLYLRRYWQYQQHLAEQIKSRLISVEQTQSQLDWQQQRLDYYFKEDTEEGVTNWQQLAAERALSHQFLILSGGPGTGKTTTITRILALLIEQHSLMLISGGGATAMPRSSSAQESDSLKTLIAAPTGKAAIRMQDSIRIAHSQLDLPEQILAQMPTHASSIHKLLGYKHESVQFKHNCDHALNADVVLVDEASMIDLALMSKLIEAVPAQAKLILIGDKDQLSSVETGSVFADMCSGLEKSQSLVTLQKNWRFKKDSGIGQLAIAANNGNSQKLLEILQDKSQPECELVSPTSITNQIRDDLIAPWKSYFKVLDNPDSSIAEIFKAFNQYRVLCALRRGLNGSSIMSSRIETALSKQDLINMRSSFGQDQLLQNGSSSWYSGRPVMITQNSYSKGLFNGDTGITLIRNGELKVFFPDEGEGFKSFAPVRLPAHETTWAMTIHKSQGSEFNQVALILPHEVMPLLTRQLIYTGITRAKEKVSIVATEAVLSAGVMTEMVQATRLETFLQSKTRE